ncbi:MAG: hypothetical protein E6J46_04725 [Chloroflexi bacterium]|nr:MAG: hypothetical protein E6J46_04725 [Chloroflexota bacterium]
MPSVEEELARRLARGEEVVVATVIKLDGRPPSQAGAKLLMSRTASIAGTLGCSEFDSAALADSAEIAGTGAPQIRNYRHDLGSIEVYLEAYSASPLLVIFAATPVARALLRWAPEVGFRTALVETRAERLEGEDWPDAISTLRELTAALAGDVYIVHTDHDAADGHHLEALRAKGVSEDVIARIQSPVGLDLGATTPAEIALSILAGLVAVRRGGQAGWKSTNG